jgi:transposase
MIMRIVSKDAPCVRHAGKTEMKRMQSDAIRKKIFAGLRPWIIWGVHPRIIRRKNGREQTNTLQFRLKHL